MAVATPDTVRTIQEGVLDKPSARSRATSPEARRAQQIRENIDKAVQEGRPAESPLEAFRNNQDAVDRTKSDEVLNGTFDFTLDATTSTGSSLGADRLRNAQEARDISETYLDKDGYKKLNSVQKDVVRAQLQDEISKQTWGSEIIAKHAARGGNGLNNFLDRWATDPDFRQTVRDVKREIIDNPPDVVALQTAIDSAVTLEAQRDKAITEKGAEIIENSADQTKAQGELEDFGKDSINTSGKVVKISQQREMDAHRKQLDKDQPQYDKDVADFNTIVGSTFGGQWNPHHGIDIDPVDRATLLASPQWAAIKPLQDRMVAYEATETSHQNLADRKASLEAHVAAAQSEGDRLDAEIVTFTRERGAASADIQTGKINRAQAEQNYADKLTNVFSEAMHQHIEEREEYRDVAMRERIITEADREPDPMKKALKLANVNHLGGYRIDADGKLVDHSNRVNVLDGMQLLTAEHPEDAALHFINPATGNRYTVAELTAATIANPAFLDQFGTGPDAVMRQLTMTQINPATGVNYTLSEVNAKLAADPEFFSANQNDVITNLVRKGALTKQIRPEMTQRIINAPGWGGDAFLKSILETQEVQDVYAKKGTIGSLQEMFKDKKKLPWLIGLILAFGPVGGLAAILVAAKIKG